MDYFTQEDMKPSDKTLALIRQVAHTFRIKACGRGMDVCCLN